MVLIPFPDKNWLEWESIAKIRYFGLHSLLYSLLFSELKDINKYYILYSFLQKDYEKIEILMIFLIYQENGISLVTVDYFHKNVFILGVEDKSIALIPLQGFAKVAC